MQEERRARRRWVKSLRKGQKWRGESERERQVSRMEASDTWCCNKAKWIVEEEEERSGTAVTAALYLRTSEGRRQRKQSRDRADVIFD